MDNLLVEENKNIIEIKDLVVEYHTDDDVVHAVNGISLSLERGKTLGLVGETGAGKTTLALTLMQLLPKVTGKIPSGSILFDGKDLLNTSEKEMRLIRGSLIPIFLIILGTTVITFGISGTLVQRFLKKDGDDHE